MKLIVKVRIYHILIYIYKKKCGFENWVFEDFFLNIYSSKTDYSCFNISRRANNINYYVIDRITAWFLIIRNFFTKVFLIMENQNFICTYRCLPSFLLLFQLTFLIDWKNSKKYPALILFFINICFFLSSIGWMAQFSGEVRTDIVCKGDGTIRKGGPQWVLSLWKFLILCSDWLVFFYFERHDFPINRYTGYLSAK